MWIAIDIREACRPRPTGKGVWTRGCVAALLKTDHTFLLFTDGAPPPDWEGLPNVEIVIFPPGAGWHVRAMLLLRHRKPDVYLSPTSFLIPALLRSVCCVPVVHDLIAFRGEPHDRKAVLMERMLLGRAVRGAARVCCISESTRGDLLARYPLLAPEHVIAVFAGPLRVSPPPRATETAGIVCIATLCPRKNQLRLIQAYTRLPQSLRERHPLLLAGGRGWCDAEIVALAARTPGVRWLHYVSDDEYDMLLSQCAVFAYPSLYEGFGLPVLDALQRGIPVLTSARGSLKEIAGAAALLVDPEDTDAIAAGLQRLLTDGALQSALVREGPLQASAFSWERTAELVLGALTACR